MWTIEKLRKRFGMSEQQIYRRLNAARRLLDSHIKRGDKNAILLTEGGFRILENIIELEKQGKTLSNAVLEVENLLQDTSKSGVSAASGDEFLEEHRDKLEELEKTDIASLIEEIGYLKGQLDLKDELLRELREELAHLRQENEELKRKVAIVEYKEHKRWWQFWR